MYIPKNFKKVREVTLTVNDLITFEDKIKKIYEKGDILAPIHLSKGNEKQLIKIFSYINKNDWVFSSWRSHYHALLHGIPEKILYNQIMDGKSMYVASKKHKFMSSSIAGGTVPIALGLSLAIKKRKQNSKVWCFLGDMTFNMGVFYEAYNYSRNFDLPLEFVLEDNGKSVYTDTKKVWGIKNKISIPKDIFYYKYKLQYPHHGTGKFVEFK